MHEIGQRRSGRLVWRRTLTTRPCGEPSGGWPSGSRSSAQRSSREPASVASERRPLHGGTATIATLRGQARRWARREKPLLPTCIHLSAAGRCPRPPLCAQCRRVRLSHKQRRMRGASAAAAAPATW